MSVGKATRLTLINVGRTCEFFQSDSFFFLNPCARLFYRKWQSSVLLKENDCIGPNDRLLRMKPVVCISFPLIFFLRKYNYTSWGILCHPLLITFSQPKPLWCDRFHPLITAGRSSPTSSLLAPVAPACSTTLRSPTGHNLCPARGSIAHTGSCKSKPGSKSWETLLGRRVRCRRTSWIVPWFWISWSGSLGLGKDLYDKVKFLCLFSWGVLHSSLCLCDERGREWTISRLVKASACLFIHVLSLAPFCDDIKNKEKKNAFLHVTLCAYFQMDSIQKDIPIAFVVILFLLSRRALSDSFLTSWTTASQALSMGFPRQEYWRGLSFPALGYLPHPGIEPASPVLAGVFLTTEPPGKPLTVI